MCDGYTPHPHPAPVTLRYPVPVQYPGTHSTQVPTALVGQANMTWQGVCQSPEPADTSHGSHGSDGRLYLLGAGGGGGRITGQQEGSKDSLPLTWQILFDSAYRKVEGGILGMKPIQMDTSPW